MARPWDYDLLCRLLEEGRDQEASPSLAPEVLQEPPPKPRGRTIPFWASAIRGFSNATCLLMLTCLALPLGMQCKDGEQAFLCGALVVISFSFPFMGYMVTSELPPEGSPSQPPQRSTQVRVVVRTVVTCKGPGS